MSSTVCVLLLSVLHAVQSVLSLQPYISVLSLIMSSTVCVLPLSVLHAVKKCVITSTVYWCVVTHYELNCLRVTAFSVTCSAKCVIASTGVLSLIMTSTVCVLPLSVLHAV